MAPEPTDPSPSTPFIPGFATALGGAAAHLNERLLDTRIVVVGGEINDASANTVCSQLLVLDAASPGDTPGPPGDRRKDISLYINSPGGSVDAGFAIYDTMQSLDCDVVTVAMGLAASMGHLLLVGGTPGKRFALRHSQILMHQPHGQMSGVASDILVHADHIAAVRRLMAERIAFHTGQPVDRVVADFDRDRWFSAEEALEYGMIDAVLDHRSQLRSLPYGTKSSRRTPPNPPAQARLS
ncbi:MAG TPA: ATP-dependent Clp protease proteolytic subunit [Acidimicrobiia bacterium]|nr:ATP-dependent Clp protease proteolytic subunit [Acidimicrobiia bacterium]